MKRRPILQMLATFLSGVALTLLLVACPSGGGGGTPPDAEQLRVVPRNADYGAVAVGGSATQSFTLTNTGRETLYGEAVVTGGPFEVIDGGTFALAAGRSQTLRVNFTPNAAGVSTGTITLTGTGIAPIPGLSVSPTTLDLGEVLIGASNSGVFTLSNTGNTTVTGGVTLPAGPFTLIAASNYTLAPGETRDVAISFTPATAGDVTRTLSFSGAGPLAASVSGRGVTTPPAAPAISVTPGSASFGNVETGAAAQATFTVRNSGGGTLSGSASVTGSGFSIQSGGSYNLTAGQSQSVTVRFAPTTTGGASGTLTFSGAGGASAPLSGTGTPPVPPAIALTPGSQSFGNVVLGASADRTFTLSNSGGGTLSGSASVTGSGFSIQSGGSYNLTAGQSQSVTVRFTPSSATSASGTLTFSGGGGASAGLSGTGVPEPEPAISVTPSSQSFGDVALGASADRTFTLSNSGGKTLSGSASISGSGFSIQSGGSYNLTAGQSQTVTVRFTPTTTGGASGTLTFSGGGGASAGLSGTGTTPPTPVIAPSSSTCHAGTAVGATCNVTVSLSQSSGAFGGLQFTLGNTSFKVISAVATGVTTGCFGAGGSSGIVGIVCEPSVSGNGAVASVTVERLASGPSTFSTSTAHLTVGTSEIPANGGSLGVP
jgi:hypothetical protein